jgi:GcrA cell cycle regulator
MTWTDARIAQLTRLWTEGVSASGIADALGDVSRSAVLGKLHRLHLLGARQTAAAPRRYEGPVLAAALALRPVPRPWRPTPTPTPTPPPEPPRSPWREEAFAPLAGTAARPWLSREVGECAFPVGGEGEALMSCCAQTRSRSVYCEAHHAIVFKTQSPAARAAEQRRWAESATRWAA